MIIGMTNLWLGSQTDVDDGDEESEPPPPKFKTYLEAASALASFSIQRRTE